MVMSVYPTYGWNSTVGIVSGNVDVCGAVMMSCVPLEALARSLPRHS